MKRLLKFLLLAAVFSGSSASFATVEPIVALNKADIEKMKQVKMNKPEEVEIPLSLRYSATPLPPTAYKQNCIQTRLSEKFLRLNCHTEFLTGISNSDGSTCGNGVIYWNLAPVPGYVYKQNGVVSQAMVKGVSSYATQLPFFAINLVESNSGTGGQHFGLTQQNDWFGSNRTQKYIRCNTASPNHYRFVTFTATFTLVKAP